MSYFIQILHLLISLECITSLHQNIYTPYADTPTHKTNCQHDQAAELGTILSASPKSPIYRIFFLSSVGKRDNNDPYDLIYWCINYNWISNARFLFFKYGHQKLSTAKLSTLRVHLVKNQKSNRIERNRPPLNEPTTITTNHKFKKKQTPECGKKWFIIRCSSTSTTTILFLLYPRFKFTYTNILDDSFVLIT